LFPDPDFPTFTVVVGILSADVNPFGDSFLGGNVFTLLHYWEISAVESDGLTRFYAAPKGGTAAAKQAARSETPHREAHVCSPRFRGPSPPVGGGGGLAVVASDLDKGGIPCRGTVGGSGGPCYAGCWRWGARPRPRGWGTTGASIMSLRSSGWRTSTTRGASSPSSDSRSLRPCSTPWGPRTAW